MPMVAIVVPSFATEGTLLSEGWLPSIRLPVVAIEVVSRAFVMSCSLSPAGVYPSLRGKGLLLSVSGVRRRAVRVPLALPPVALLRCFIVVLPIVHVMMIVIFKSLTWIYIALNMRAR